MFVVLDTMRRAASIARAMTNFLIMIGFLCYLIDNPQYDRLQGQTKKLGISAGTIGLDFKKIH